MHATRPIYGTPELGTAISDEIEYHIGNARRIRAAALNGAGRRAGRRLGAAGRAVRLRLDRWAAERSLRLLSDRSLADIGIPRHAIPLTVRGMDGGAAEADQPVRDERPGSLARRIELWRERQSRRRRLERELQAYSDQDLEELGIFRSDIPRVASAAA